ncbi:MAG TPA: AMP-binding protein [Candidatus Cybelea sp.]|nr:AMP-binding protein [Candidatus Cybelea sp.]
MTWRQPEPVPLDRDGPVSQAYEIPSTDFVERSIFELFEDIASAIPESGALSDGTAILTYAEVRREIRRLAGAISARAPAGRAVAVLLQNTPSSVIAVLACLAAGRCCLVLNADHPKERNAGILRSAGIHAAVIWSEDCAEASILPDSARPIVFGATPPEEEAWKPTPLGPDEPAIVLYTSGSTGAPKGIVLSQATILTRVRNNIIAMHLSPADSFLSLGALGTTAGLVASVIALLGGALQIVVSVTATGASNLLDLIRDERVSIVWGVPALLRLLFENKATAEALESLRVVRTFGDQLLSTECAVWREALPSACHLAITYGQTESTIAQWFVPRDFMSDHAALPAGYLLPEHEFAIVQEDRVVGAQDDVGELVLRSRYVALGEWEHGRLASGRVLPDPIDVKRRILRTGDVVRLRPDGLLQVLGRVDRQVKINGQRVEPAEIENAVRRVSGVANAAVAVRRNGEETNLLAFVVASNLDDSALLDRIRRAIRVSLPNYMQPARVLLVEELPLLPGGKVDHQALLKIEAASPKQEPIDPASRRLRGGIIHALSRMSNVSTSAGQITPARQTIDAERAVAIAWRHVLGSAPVPGVAFLDAAGDSLRLLELVFALETRTGRQLPLDAFSAEATAADMAAALDRLLRNPVPSQESRRVFLLPGARGDTPGLAGLRADCLPVAAIQMITYPDWREMLRAGLTFDRIAEAALTQIRATAPTGPVCLIGYSFGVLVAFIAAQMLEKEQRTVAQLVLIDMPPPPQGTGESRSSSPAATNDEAWWSMTKLRRMARDTWWTVNRLGSAARQGMVAERFGMIVSPFATNVVRRSGLRALFTSPMTKGWSRYLGEFGYWTKHHMGQELRLQAIHEWAQRWRSSGARLRAPLLLVRTAAHEQGAPNDLGWRELAEHVQVAQVQGTHVSMLSATYRRAVSDAVGAALAKALSASRDPIELGKNETTNSLSRPPSRA